MFSLFEEKLIKSNSLASAFRRPGAIELTYFWRSFPISNLKELIFTMYFLWYILSHNHLRRLLC